MGNVTEIILKKHHGISVRVQDRQQMRIGHPARTFTLKGSYPPVSLPIDWAGKLSFPLDGNTRYGDCMYAAACHADNTFTGNNDGEFYFKEQDIIDDYLQLSGGDNGLNAGVMIGAWKRGLAHVDAAIINDALNLNPNDTAAMQAAVYFFGGVVFSLALPDSWSRRFTTGRIWNAPATPNPKHGHAVWWNGVDANGKYKLQTWGTYGWITPAGVAVCDPSCFVVFSPRWFGANGIAPNKLGYLHLGALWQQFGGGRLPFRSRSVLNDTTPLGPALTEFNGRTYVAFKGETNNNIYLVSSGNGVQFTGAPLADTTTCSPAVASFNGELYVAFKGETNNNIYVTSSKNGQPPFNTRQLWDTTPLSPAIAPFNGRIYVAYKGLTNNNVYVTSSVDGHSFGNILQSGETTTRAPVLCAHNGKFYVAFKAEMSNNLIVVEVLVAPNGTISLGARSVLNDTSLFGPALASFNGRLYIAYKGLTNNNVYVISSGDGLHFTDRFESFETTIQPPSLCANNGKLYVGFRAEMSNNLIVVSP